MQAHKGEIKRSEVGGGEGGRCLVGGVRTRTAGCSTRVASGRGQNIEKELEVCAATHSGGGSTHRATSAVNKKGEGGEGVGGGGREEGRRRRKVNTPCICSKGAFYCAGPNPKPFCPDCPEKSSPEVPGVPTPKASVPSAASTGAVSSSSYSSSSSASQKSRRMSTALL